MNLSTEAAAAGVKTSSPILSDDWSVDNLEWDANSVLFSFRSESGTTPSILASGTAMFDFRLH